LKWSYLTWFELIVLEKPINYPIFMERDLVTEAIVAAKKRMASFEGFIAEKDEASTKFIA